MKNVGKVLAVMAVVVGISASQFVRSAHAAQLSCPGSGQHCATDKEGTVFVKGGAE